MSSLKRAVKAALAEADAQGLIGPAFAQLKYGIARRAMAEGDAYGPLFADGTLALQASDVFEGGILATGRMPQRKIGADVGGIRERILAVAAELRLDLSPIGQLVERQREHPGQRRDEVLHPLLVLESPDVQQAGCRAADGRAVRAPHGRDPLPRAHAQAKARG